ncbi:MAG: hypothetical protein GF335_02430 [Candidatus Moranbacteria bacterium]|nr:hypothetical protein [Candidatus Moranbacteria bacterium]
MTDCTLGDRGFPPGDNFKNAMDSDNHIEDLITNGLEVITKKQVFHSDGVDSINCPNCNNNMIDSDWGDLLEKWYKDLGNDNLKCSSCKCEFPITSYNFNPFWGFGYLGFNFWNWGDLKVDFIKEIESLLNVKVKLIYGRI